MNDRTHYLEPAIKFQQAELTATIQRIFNMADITINEALVWKKTLAERHAELVSLRNENSAEVTRRYGVGGDKEVTKHPTYDVKVLDKMITMVAREQRLLDQAIKNTNGVTKVIGYSQDDKVLGELV